MVFGLYNGMRLEDWKYNAMRSDVMNPKFEKVVNEFNKHDVIFGDDALIHEVLEKCDISIDELHELAGFLAVEYDRTGDSKVEQLHFGINFIFEARSEGYKVNYKSKYIN